MNRLRDKTALIVGGGSGIGAATARLFSDEGANIVVTDLHEQAARRIAQEIEATGGHAVALAADVRRGEDIRRAVDTALQLYGGLDILHANAGVASVGRAHELTEDAWSTTLAINLTGAFLCAKYALPALMDSGHGAIVFTSSSAGIIGDRETPAYCASKGGIVMLTRQLAVDYARDRVRVNCICPGWIDTPFNDPFISSTDAHAQTIEHHVPLGRQGNVEEVARSVLYLVSDDASYVTGHALVIDGGLTIW